MMRNQNKNWLKRNRALNSRITMKKSNLRNLKPMQVSEVLLKSKKMPKVFIHNIQSMGMLNLITQFLHQNITIRTRLFKSIMNITKINHIITKNNVQKNLSKKRMRRARFNKKKWSSKRKARKRYPSREV